MRCFTAMLLVSVLLSCEKEDTNPTGGTGDASGINYTLTAPSCRITEVYAPSLLGHIYYHYDMQRRIVLVEFEVPDVENGEKTEYSYVGNIMTEKSTFRDWEGKEIIRVDVHTLNSAGLIEKTTSDDRSTGGLLLETFYYYNSGGYLMREIEKHAYDTTSVYYTGRSYSYSNGDKSKSYRLHIDSKGEVFDSTINITYTYHLNRLSRIEPWIAWNERKGRPSLHDVKSESGKDYMYTIEYKFGADEYPIRLTQNIDGEVTDMELTWKCN